MLVPAHTTTSVVVPSMIWLEAVHVAALPKAVDEVNPPVEVVEPRQVLNEPPVLGNA